MVYPLLHTIIIIVIRYQLAAGYMYIIQGVSGGTDQTSEECSLGHTIPI